MFKRILKGVLHWAPLAIDLQEATGLTGKMKALGALDMVADAIGLDDLDEPVANGVADGIRMINDGLVMIQNHAGNFAVAAAARKEVERKERALIREGQKAVKAKEKEREERKAARRARAEAASK